MAEVMPGYWEELWRTNPEALDPNAEAYRRRMESEALRHAERAGWDPETVENAAYRAGLRRVLCRDVMASKWECSDGSTFTAQLGQGVVVEDKVGIWDQGEVIVRYA